MGLPSGTVTLLFSDVEGSTRLLLKLQAEYAAALDVHRAVLRQAWLDHQGVEVGTEGDSFMVAFASATDAVGAALAGQLGLQEAVWPGDEPMRVRMGVHTGTPTPHGDGYVGMDVHVAARVAAAANGGQVLLSASTATLVRDHVTVRDMGRHQLKDLPAPEHLFMLEGSGLPDVSTPVRSLGSISNLPEPSTPLVGRDQVVRECAELLRRPHQRLVTLTGPGGSGKTRLAIAVAAATAGGQDQNVYFVALEGAARADEMWAALASALGVPAQERDVRGALEHLRHDRALLVLDNLEQVHGASGVIHELLEAAREVSVLATSRHPMHVQGEQEYPVPPLAVPRSDSDLAGGAVELLLASTRRLRPSFTLDEQNGRAVVDICRRLDGLPLALEIAAARLRVLSPVALARQLDKALDLRRVESGRPARHETMRDAIAWSDDLLRPAGRRMLRGLAAFAGSADVDAVDRLWTELDDEADTLTVLEELVEASLVSLQGAGQPRVVMLETVLAFAADELRSSADEGIAYDAATSYLDELSARLYLHRIPGWRDRLADTLELEQRALRNCVAWLVAHPDPSRIATALQLTFRMHQGLLLPRSRFAEAARLLDLVLTGAGNRTGLRTAACQACKAFVDLVEGHLDEGRTLLEASARSAEDEATDADLDPDHVELMHFAIDSVRGFYYRQTGQLRESRALAERQVREVAEPWLKAVAVQNLAITAHEEGRFLDSVTMNREAADLAMSVGDESLAMAARHNRACALRVLGRLEEAVQEFEQIGGAVLSTREPALVMIFAEDYAAALSEQGRSEEAAILLGAADALREQLGLPWDETQEAELAGAMALGRLRLGDRWETLVDEGRSRSLEQLIRGTFKTAIS